jgi:hypothetical protein
MQHGQLCRVAGREGLLDLGDSLRELGPCLFEASRPLPVYDVRVTHAADSLWLSPAIGAGQAIARHEHRGVGVAACEQHPLGWPTRADVGQRSVRRHDPVGQRSWHMSQHSCAKGLHTGPSALAKTSL